MDGQNALKKIFGIAKTSKIILKQKEDCHFKEPNCKIFKIKLKRAFSNSN